MENHPVMLAVNQPAQQAGRMLAPGEALAEPGERPKKSIEPAKLATDVFNSTDNVHRNLFDALARESAILLQKNACGDVPLGCECIVARVPLAIHLR